MLDKRKLVNSFLVIIGIAAIGLFLYFSPKFKADTINAKGFSENFDNTTTTTRSTTGNYLNNPRLNIVTDQEALSGKNDLLVTAPAATRAIKSSTTCTNLLSYPLANITTGNYDINVALKGQINGDNVKIVASWQEGKSSKTYERVVLPSEVDPVNWTIIHGSFSLPLAYKSNSFNLSLIRECGTSVFVGSIDSISLNQSQIGQVSTQPPAGSSSSVPIYNSDTILLNNLISKPLYSLVISGTGTITTPTSFIRLVLTDTQGNNYQIYENNATLQPSGSFNFNQVAEETKLLKQISPAKLTIYYKDINWNIDSVRLVVNSARLDQTSQNLIKTISANNLLLASKTAVDIQRTDNYNAAKPGWTAGTTSVSQMSYDQKRNLFSGGILPNLQGFEYYKGGVFNFGSAIAPKTKITASTETRTATASTLPASIDYRNFQGEDWMTPVKDQRSAGTCWAFAMTGTTEAQINLWYNQHLNPDLSEQMAVDTYLCSTYPGGSIPEFNVNPLQTYIAKGASIIPNPKHPGVADCGFNNDAVILYQAGLADEACDPYVGRDTAPQCNAKNVSSDWKQRIWKIISPSKSIATLSTYNNIPPDNRCPAYINSLDGIKKELITKGPLWATFRPWSHAMVLEGYLQASGGEEVWGGQYPSITTTSANKNQTLLIMKNSWGLTWGDGGYAYFAADHFNDFGFMSITGPFTPPPGQSYKVSCVDKDNDGYYYWGLGSKPASCPANTPVIEDCNDTDKTVAQNNQNNSCVAPTVPVQKYSYDFNCDGKTTMSDMDPINALWRNGSTITSDLVTKDTKVCSNLGQYLDSQLKAGKTSIYIAELTRLGSVVRVSLSPLSITISKAGTGEGYLDQRSQTIAYGSSLNINVLLGSDTGFTGWTGCDSVSGVGNKLCTLSNITTDKKVTANFTSTIYTGSLDFNCDSKITLSDVDPIATLYIQKTIITPGLVVADTKTCKNLGSYLAFKLQIGLNTVSDNEFSNIMNRIMSLSM